MNPFTLHKSYLDVVDESGRCAIAYQTELEWGALALRWEALSLLEPGRDAVHHGAFGKASRSNGLGVCVKCEPWCRPFEARLLETPSATIDWICDAPGADVVVERGDGTVVRGAGYREHLVLTMQPWRLPIHELRWGRWASPSSRHSIVWIDWRGAHPLTLLLEDGQARDEVKVGDESVRWGQQNLQLAGTRTLYSRTLADILRGAGPLVRRLPASWRALEDRKSLSTGTLANESGWAVHEIVRFP